MEAAKLQPQLRSDMSNYSKRPLFRHGLPRRGGRAFGHDEAQKRAAAAARANGIANEKLQKAIDKDTGAGLFGVLMILTGCQTTEEKQNR